MRSHYDGRATLEIELNKVTVDTKTLRPSYFEGWAKLLIGTPEEIGGELLHPVELPVFFNFDVNRDGEVAWEEALRFSLGQTLERMFRGSSVLLKA